MTGNVEKGLAVFEEIYGKDMADSLGNYMNSGRFGAEVSRWAMDLPFGQIWPRAQLERKKRSCAVLGMVIALRQSDEIAYHTKMALVNGLTKEEIEEVLYSAVPYCGIPAANVAKAAMIAAFKDLGMDVA